MEASSMCSLVHPGANLCRYKVHEKQSSSLLVLCLDCILINQKEGVLEEKQQMIDRIDCDEVDEIKEYIGFKINLNQDN